MSVLIGFNLLDRQIVDRDGTPVGKVDDVELGRTDDGRVRVVALITGQQALGRRLGGPLGRWVTATARQLDRDRRGPRRIPYRLVSRVDSAVHLSVRRDLLPEEPMERWLDRQ